MLTAWESRFPFLQTDHPRESLALSPLPVKKVKRGTFTKVLTLAGTLPWHIFSFNPYSHSLERGSYSHCIDEESKAQTGDPHLESTSQKLNGGAKAST